MRVLSNLAFFQSRTWRESTGSICRETESPDTMPVALQVFRLLRKRKKADIVLTMGARPSLFYGLACAALGVDSKQAMMEVFPDYPAQENLLFRLKRAAFRFVSKRARGVIAAARAEADELAERFGFPREKVVFVPLYTTVDPSAAVTARDGGYVFAGGRSWRDWPTMVAAAGKLDCPVVLAVGADADIPSPVPANVQVFRELPYEQYLERLRNARAVAVPLVPIGRSTGQIALLEAMAYGKAVAASAVAGVADYVRHGTNALLVPPRDPEAMAEALARLVSDGALRARLARTALSDAETRYAMEPYARRLLSALESFSKARI